MEEGQSNLILRGLRPDEVNGSGLVVGRRVGHTRYTFLACFRSALSPTAD